MKTLQEKIIEAYIPGETTLREVARQCKTDHHQVKRTLIIASIPVIKGKKAPPTQEHRDKISKACKGRDTWNTGKKMPIESIYKNMSGHLRFNVTTEWLKQFSDIEKLKFLNHSLIRKRDSDGFDTNRYKKFILKFYGNDKFNLLYKKWVETGDKWIKPSLDHINPKSNGGRNEIANLQFLSWLENRSKSDMSQEKWDIVKKNIGWYFNENY